MPGTQGLGGGCCCGGGGGLTINVIATGVCALNDGVGVTATVKYPGGAVAGSGTVQAQPTGSPMFTWNGNGPAGTYIIQVAAAGGAQVKFGTGAIGTSAQWNFSVPSTQGSYSTSFSAYPAIMHVTMRFPISAVCGFAGQSSSDIHWSNTWTVKIQYFGRPGTQIASGTGDGDVGLPWPAGAAKYDALVTESASVPNTGSTISPGVSNDVTCGSTIGSTFYPDATHMNVIVPGGTVFMPIALQYTDPGGSIQLDGYHLGDGTPYYQGSLGTTFGIVMYPCNNWNVTRSPDNMTAPVEIGSGTNTVNLVVHWPNSTTGTITGNV